MKLVNAECQMTNAEIQQSDLASGIRHPAFGIRH